MTESGDSSPPRAGRIPHLRRAHHTRGAGLPRSLKSPERLMNLAPGEGPVIGAGDDGHLSRRAVRRRTRGPAPITRRPGRIGTRTDPDARSDAGLHGTPCRRRLGAARRRPGSGPPASISDPGPRPPGRPSTAFDRARPALRRSPCAARRSLAFGALGDPGAARRVRTLGADRRSRCRCPSKRSGRAPTAIGALPSPVIPRSSTTSAVCARGTRRSPGRTDARGRPPRARPARRNTAGTRTRARSAARSRA